MNITFTSVLNGESQLIDSFSIPPLEPHIQREFEQDLIRRFAPVSGRLGVSAREGFIDMKLPMEPAAGSHYANLMLQEMFAKFGIKPTLGMDLAAISKEQLHRYHFSLETVGDDRAIRIVTPLGNLLLPITEMNPGDVMLALQNVQAGLKQSIAIIQDVVIDQALTHSPEPAPEVEVAPVMERECTQYTTSVDDSAQFGADVDQSLFVVPDEEFTPESPAIDTQADMDTRPTQKLNPGYFAILGREKSQSICVVTPMGDLPVYTLTDRGFGSMLNDDYKEYNIGKVTRTDQGLTLVCSGFEKKAAVQDVIKYGDYVIGKLGLQGKFNLTVMSGKEASEFLRNNDVEMI